MHQHPTSEDRKEMEAKCSPGWISFSNFSFLFQIADFGMSRDLMDESYYVAHGGKIPVKWTSPEVRSCLGNDQRKK